MHGCACARGGSKGNGIGKARYKSVVLIKRVVGQREWCYKSNNKSGWRARRLHASFVLGSAAGAVSGSVGGSGRGDDSGGKTHVLPPEYNGTTNGHERKKKEEIVQEQKKKENTRTK